MKIRKKVTPKKRAAQELNAEKSTGPKTERGKFFASQNAVSHGIFAREMLLPGESAEEFARLRDDTISDRAPVETREFRRVEKLIWHEWRWRRFIRAENGEIAKLLADHQPAAEMAASTHTPLYNQAVTALKLLEQIEEHIGSEGRVSADNLDSIRKLPYFDAVKYFLQVVAFVQPAEPEDDIRPGLETPAAEVACEGPTAAKDDAPSEAKREFARDLLIQALDVMKTAISLEELHHAQHLGRRSLAKRNICLLPQEADLNRLMRYENHLSRNIDRDENALERMQRLRRGEKVPPPTARMS
jgi:hypothetical protein